MQYNTLGKSGLKVSKLVLGTMNFGVFTEEKEAFRIMDAALDAGINFFDTANIYGLAVRKLYLERNSMAQCLILWMVPNNDRGLSAYKLRRHLEESLRRLQTDHIELYQMHHHDRGVSWDEIWEAFQIAQYQGKIGYIGSSNFAGRDLVKAQYEAKSRGMLGLVSEQHKYNLLCRLPELEVLPAAQDQGIGVIVWSPLDGGLLSGKALNPAAESKRAGSNNIRVEQHRSQLEAFAALCSELEESEANIALAWTLANPAVTAPIIGPRTLAHLENALRAVNIVLEESIQKRLDEIFPGPGGTAPDIYAW